MIVEGKGISTTWRECHALGLTLLGESAWDIAVGEVTGAQWDEASLAPFEDWDERVHDDEDDRCIGIDNTGASALVAWWLAMTEDTLRAYQGFPPRQMLA